MSKIKKPKPVHPRRDGKPLTPPQLGCLAWLVHEALTKFPTSRIDGATTRKIFDTEDFMEDWERWLQNQVDTKIQDCDLPSYSEIGGEVEMLVEYYAYQHSMV